MSSGDERRRPDPNVISFEKHVSFTLPMSQRYQPWASEEQTYNLWGREFKFTYQITWIVNEFVPNRLEASLTLMNRSARPVWIGSGRGEKDYVEVLPNETNESLRMMPVVLIDDWRNEFTVASVFDILLGIDYHPEPSLQQDLLALVRDRKFTDFKLKLSQEEFPCHKAILAARSSVLSNALEFNSNPTDQHELDGINPPEDSVGFSPESVQRLLDALYTGRVSHAALDDSVKVLADYFDVELDEEEVLELQPYGQGQFNVIQIGVPGEDLQTLRDFSSCSFPLLHSIQIEPSFAAKRVLLTWTVPNYMTWREDQPGNSVMLEPEKRITLLGKEFPFGCRLEWNDVHEEKASLVFRGEGLAVVRGKLRAYSQLEIFRHNSFNLQWDACQHQGDDLVVNFQITLLEYLDLGEESRLQQDLRRLLEDCLQVSPDEAKEKKFTDFKLCCSGQKFPCHKAILSARSPSFAQILEENPDADEHEVPSSMPAKVKQMLEFIYTGTLTGEADLDLLKLAREFRINGLVTITGRSLAKTLSLANALDLLSETYNQSDGALKNLKDSALSFIAKNFLELLETDQWKHRDFNHLMEDDIFYFFFFRMEQFCT